MNALRPVVVAILAICALALESTAADASCIQESLTDRAARAEIVVYGRVVRTEGASARSAVFQAERVLKGSVPERFTVALGPDMGGGVPVGATSVDYAVRADTDHTLFLRKEGDRYATDACAGSHAGQPTAEETAFFGTGGAPQPMPTAVGGADQTAQTLAVILTVLAIAAGVGAIAYLRRPGRRKAVA